MIQVALVPAEGAEGPVEHLHHTHAVDGLHHGALHPLLGIVKFCLKGRLVRLSETGGQHPEGDADGQQRHQRQPPVHEKQVQQGEHRRGYRRSDFAQMVGQERFNLVGVIGDNLFDGPLGGAGKVAGGDTGELFHQLEAQFINDLIGRRMGDRGGSVSADAIDQRRAEGDGTEGKNFPLVYFHRGRVMGQQLHHHAVDGEKRHNPRRGGEDRQKAGQRQLVFPRTGQLKQAGKALFFFFRFFFHMGRSLISNN